MALDERARHHLYLQLESTLGPDAATTLMEHRPPVGWADVATKRDVDALAVATKRDIDALAVATKRDIDALAVATRGDIDALAVATRGDIDALGVKIEALGDRLRAEFHKENKGLLVTIVGVNVAAVFGAASLALAAARLG